MKQNKKGFTLIELLAVIVILAIIALIATPIILNMINKARLNAAKSSTLGFIDAIEYNNGFAAVESETTTGSATPEYTAITGTKTVSEITGLKLKGKKPTAGSVTIDADGKVESADNLVFDGYACDYTGATSTVTCAKGESVGD